MDFFGVSLPTTLEELKHQQAEFVAYNEQYPIHVLLGFSVLYLFKQSFSIPGSVFLNLFAGAVFGFWQGFPMAVILTTCGASGSFLMGRFVGGPIIRKFAAERLDSFAQKIDEQRRHGGLFNYLVFLRLFPFTPNWFLNFASPIVGVPYHYFAASVFIGLIPYNLICVKAGVTLNELQSASDPFDTSAIATLFGLAFLSLVPVILSKTVLKSKDSDHHKVQ
eukprot:GFYU01001464.1.p1 GENE.GFYU01001464.1~~GFYU01001464.1.p1  ORF type:complete len:221 (-),score=36.41 GFYU01001464.1:525-1187(-)